MGPNHKTARELLDLLFFSTHSATVHLLIIEFNPFIFKVITDMEGLMIAILKLLFVL